MECIKTSFGDINISSLCQAHAQLESDYNVGGWLRERPSNLRRMASTGVQLSRMKYRNTYGWVGITAEPQEGDDPEDENVRIVYVVNALRYGLPIADDLKAVAQRLIVPECLHELRPELFPLPKPKTDGEPMKTVTFTLPARWASYIVDGESSSFTIEPEGEEATKKLIDDWRELENLGQCLTFSDEPFFTKTPDGPDQKGCDCMQFTFELLD